MGLLRISCLKKGGALGSIASAMIPPQITFQYRFHSAGQGLFASGTLDPLSPPNPFHWVFDCGSMSFVSVLRPVISRYRSLVVGDHLDLLCISHFDSDHVSGLSDLLRGLHVDTVVIPYYSKVERMVLTAKHKRPNPSYIEFLSDPIAFILDRAERVGRIVIAGGPEEGFDDLPLPTRQPEDPESDSPNDLKRRWHDTAWHLKIAGKGIRAEQVIDAQTLEKARRAGTQIEAYAGSLEALAVNQSVSGGGWEFLFFHKPIDPAALNLLQAELKKVFQKTIDRARKLSIAEILASKPARYNIKMAFKKVIKGGEDINSTSLCVYTGPMLSNFVHSWMTPPWPDSLMARPRHMHSWHLGAPDTCSALYTGDANLKPPTNRKELRDFLTQPRWVHVAVLQVPHHGSKNNWEDGAANEFANSYSIFSAHDTGSYGHPDREVILDLIYRGPHIVNKVHSWTVTGGASFV
jgi:hypothetical protein